MARQVVHFYSAVYNSQRLVKMISDLRDDLDAKDVPFVVGNLGTFIETHSHFPFANDINQQLDDLPNKVVNCLCASSEGLGHIGDYVHFDRNSQIEFGKRYAEKIRLLVFTYDAGNEKQGGFTLKCN